MKILNKMLWGRGVFVFAVLTVSGCDDMRISSVDDPQGPSISAPAFFEGNAQPVISVSMHPTVKNGWRLDENQLPDEGGRWAWYIRINGKNYRCNSGHYPFSSTKSELNLFSDLSDPPAWGPGKYSVTYVMRDAPIVRIDNSSVRRTLSELKSNTIVFEVR